MTAERIEAPAPPYIELRSPPLTEEQRILLTATNASADPAEAWKHALTAHRIIIINEVRKRVGAEKLLSEPVIREILDLVWQINVPFLQKVTGPMIAEAYLSAFREAKAGDVPIKMIYALAEEHARRTGDYFHSTSSDALIQGFNTYVNRQIPEKAAIERVLDAYGLTPRQMSGLTSAKQFETKAATSVPQKLKNKIKRYIGKSITDRLGLFTRQEAHNLNEQARQVAWMWMIEHGKLPKTTEKMWLTAQDERVCPICGPLHRTKIPVGDRFLLEDGQKLYVPGAHPNCRCTVRLQLRMELVTKADGPDPQFERQHPRDRGGRFIETTERMRDPQLERLVEEARRVQEEEEEAARRQIEETPEAPPTPTLRAPLGLKGPSKLRAPLSAPPVQLRAPSVQGGTLNPIQQPSLSAAAVQLRMPEAQLLAGTQRFLESLKAPAPLAPPTPPLAPPGIPPYRPTVPFLDRDGNPIRVYFVSEFSDIVKPTDQRVLISPSTELKPYNKALDNKQLATEVMKQYGKNVEVKVEDILQKAADEGYGTIDFDDRNHVIGTMDVAYPSPEPAFQGLHTVLDQDDIKAVINAYAHRNQTWASDSRFSPQWLDKEGNPFQMPTTGHQMTDRVAVYYLDFLNDPKFLELSDEDIEVAVVTLDQGYLETIDNDPEMKRTVETFYSEGNYKVSGPPSSSIGDATNTLLPVRVIHVEPEVD